MLKKVSWMFALALCVSMLPISGAQADNSSPLARMHMQRAKSGQALRARKLRTANVVAAPELDPASAAAPLALLVAAGLMLRSRRREDGQLA